MSPISRNAPESVAGINRNRHNWAEAIKQSSYYAIQTGKKPGIVLILETMKDRKFWIRLNTTVEYFGLPIDTWNIGDAEY
jgi:hypothetical protein